MVLKPFFKDFLSTSTNCLQFRFIIEIPKIIIVTKGNWNVTNNKSYIMKIILTELEKWDQLIYYTILNLWFFFNWGNLQFLGGNLNLLRIWNKSCCYDDWQTHSTRKCYITSRSYSKLTSLELTSSVGLNFF